MLELALKLLVSYLLGSLMGALILGYLRGVDIRLLGSGNAGGTNALRTQGKWFALGVVLIDVAKGWLVVAVLPHWAIPGMPNDPNLPREGLIFGCAIAATLGHVYPVWWEFRGGKGAATLIGVLLGAVPTALPLVLAVWLCAVILSGYVGLSTMLAVGVLPFVLWLQGLDSLDARLFAVLMALFVTYTHRSNIQRMRDGTENRARRLWIRSYFGSRSN
jgi:glycerol-3-phosphate acyltransferase PlsY